MESPDRMSFLMKSSECLKGKKEIFNQAFVLHWYLVVMTYS